jgi:hypothetical protein
MSPRDTCRLARPRPAGHPHPSGGASPGAGPSDASQSVEIDRIGVPWNRVAIPS